MAKTTWFLGTLLGAALITGCTASPSPRGGSRQGPKTRSVVHRTKSASPKPKAVSASVKAGARLFVQFACDKCHGAHGMGGIGNPVLRAAIPPLQHTNFSGLGGKTAIIGILQNGIILTNGQNTGVVNMPAWNGILTTKQMGELADYIEAGTPDLPVKPLPTATGPELYVAYACEKCHGAYGRGGVVNVGSPVGSGHHLVPTLTADNFAKDPSGYRNALWLGVIIHEGYPEGKIGALLMPAWGQIIPNRQETRLLAYLQNGR